jgi:acyl-coenzyme A synthetase/AMP-(fatty) acid ligase
MLRKTPDSNDHLLNAFLHHVGLTPHKKAIIYNDIALSYQEFEEIVRLFACLLKQRYSHIFDVNAKQPILIGVMCQSKLHALCYEFAILALGAAFVPFHVSDARKRQEFMLAKSGISLMLIDDNSYKVNDSIIYCNFSNLISAEENVKEAVHYNYNSYDFSYSDSKPSDLAYVLFTSGSTAKHPKGVMRSRLSLYNQMAGDYTKDLKITKEDCLLNLAVFTHDQAIVDCFAALLNGCTLCLYDAQSMNVNHLHAFMKKNRVSIFSSIPSMFSIIFENINDRSSFPDLRVVTIGGEETLIKHALLYQKTCPDNCVLINGYGATEISWAASYEINHETDLSVLSAIPLGYVTQSAKIKLIPIENEDLVDNEKPVDNHGLDEGKVIDKASDNLYELGIMSESLSCGYLHDQEASSHAFFRDQENNYCYRSGDLVSLDQNNCLHYFGRKAWHEKIHGKRINLNEVENLLRMYLENCAVIAHGEAEQKKLYAFYSGVLSGKSLDEMDVQLQQLLEKHMHPQFIILSELPVLLNGKIDRQFLHNILEMKSNEFKASLDKIKELQKSDDLAQAMQGFWREVLQIPLNLSLNKDETFKSCGGDSQLAILLINKISHYFKEKHQLNISIDPFVLYKNADNFLAFYHYVASLYTQTKQQKQDNVLYSRPEMMRVQAQLAYGYRYHSMASRFYFYNGYYGNFDELAKNGATNKELEKLEIKLIEYSYVGLEMLVHHFNQLHNINIILCPSRADIIDNIKKFISNPNSPSQVGLILFLNNAKEAHPYPLVLCKNIENNTISILVADSLQGFTCLNRALDNIADIKKFFPNLDVRFDLTGRQIDVNSCSTDTLLYLINALQCDMLKQSTFLSTTLATAASDNAGYICKIVMDKTTVPEILKPCLLFISPVETFYHSNVINIPEIADIKPCNEAAALIAKLQKNASLKKHERTCYFICIDWGNRYQRPALECSTILWDKSYEFKFIIDSILENQDKIACMIQQEKENSQQAINAELLEDANQEKENSEQAINAELLEDANQEKENSEQAIKFELLEDANQVVNPGNCFASLFYALFNQPQNIQENINYNKHNLR